MEVRLAFRKLQNSINPDASRVKYSEEQILSKSIVTNYVMHVRLH
jgi:hypothetical protein